MIDKLKKVLNIKSNQEKKKFRGKRVRANDINLVIRTLLLGFFFLYLVFFFLINVFTIRFSIKQGYGLLEFFSLLNKNILLGYVFPAMLSATFLGFLYQKFPNYFEDLKIKQLLAEMIIDNNLCDVSTDNNSAGWFTDMPFGEKKHITFFPKMTFERFESVIVIQIGTTMKSYQEKLLDLDNQLEIGLFCEVIQKEQFKGFFEYTLLPDVITNRISIDEAVAKNGSIRLMKNVSWKYDNLPHMLIAGGTGGGKTYLILTLIETFLRSNAEITVLDPKNADLADLETVMDNVYHTKDDIIGQVDKFYEDMLQCSETMKTLPKYRTGKNYAYVGLPAHFLIFDEYVAFMDMLSSKEQFDVLSKLKKIVMLGRQAGYFLVMACQRPDAKYFGEGIRDQFHFRLALGLMSEIGYGTMFGETKKRFCFKKIKGRGYFSNGSEVISEFYTPTVPENHDFLATISKLYKERRDGCDCEA